MRFENHSAGASKDAVLQIRQGGTGGSNNSAALRNLGGFSLDEVGKALGVVGYTPETKKIPAVHLPESIGSSSAITIEGPNTVGLGESVLLKITNFDSFTLYTVTGHNVLVSHEDDTIMVTGAGIGDDGYVKVNDSIFPMNVSFSGDVFAGDTLGQADFNRRVTDLMATPDCTYILAASKSTSYVGSQEAGDLTLYRRELDNTMTPLRLLSPALLSTIINYAGQGAKAFTANNTTTNRTGNGSITFDGAGNIRVQGTGDVIVTPATPAQGNQDYPNGLPPFQASRNEYSFSGTRTMVVDLTGRHVQGEELGVVTFNFTVTAYSQDLNQFVPVGLMSFNAIKSNGQNIANYFVPYQGSTNNRVVGVTNPTTGSASFGISLLFYGTGTLVFDENGGGVFYNGTMEEVITPPVLINGTGVFTVYPQQGLQQYPNGLPPYQPGTPETSETATVSFTSDNFELSGTAVDSIVQPFKNYRLGSSLALADTGTFATGFSRINTTIQPNGGEVIVNHYAGLAHTLQRINIPKTAPYPEFGQAVALTANGDRLLVSAPGDNRLYLYAKVNNLFVLQSNEKPVSVLNTARLGERLVTTSDFNRVYAVAPGENAIYVYSINGNAFTFIEKILVGNLNPLLTIGSKVATVSNANILYFNATIEGSSNKVIEIRKANGVWSITKTFDNPAGNTPDQFATSFVVSRDAGIMMIGAPGSESIRGVIHMWIYASGQWLHFDSFIEDNGGLGDGFSSFMALGQNGDQLVTLTKGASTDQLLYLE
jgi:hypothetical protein